MTEKHIDLNRFCDYLFARAEELQHKKQWDAAFECLHAVTCINRGYVFDKYGNKIDIETAHEIKKNVPRMCDKTPYQPAPPTTCCHVRRDGRGCAIFDDQDCSGADDTQWCFMRCIVVRALGTGMDFTEDYLR